MINKAEIHGGNHIINQYLRDVEDLFMTKIEN
jgi:hypothetical protein